MSGLTSLLNAVIKNESLWKRAKEVIESGYFKISSGCFNGSCVFRTWKLPARAVWLMDISYYQGCNANDHIFYYLNGAVVHVDDLCCKGLYHLFRIVPADSIRVVKSSGNCYRTLYVLAVPLEKIG